LDYYLFHLTDPLTSLIFTLSLHDALPIFAIAGFFQYRAAISTPAAEKILTISSAQWIPSLGIEYHLAADGISLTLVLLTGLASKDRKSTRLYSSHRTISYAVFCLKKNTTY